MRSVDGCGLGRVREIEVGLPEEEAAHRKEGVEADDTKQCLENSLTRVHDGIEEILPRSG